MLTMSICRILANARLRVAPFKPLVVSSDLIVMENGKVMDKAVYGLAEAARIKPSPTINPILIRPETPYVKCDVFGRDYDVELYLQGEYRGRTSISALHSQTGHLRGLIRESYAEAAAESDVAVIEGAGNPVEGGPLALLANVEVAQLTNATCILVTDSGNAGPVAAVLGTIELLEAQHLETKGLAGVVFNKGAGPMLDASSINYLKTRNMHILGDCTFAVPGSPEFDLVQEEAAKAMGPKRLRPDSWYDLLAKVLGGGLDLPELTRSAGWPEGLCLGSQEVC